MYHGLSHSRPTSVPHVPRCSALLMYSAAFKTGFVIACVNAVKLATFACRFAFSFVLSLLRTYWLVNASTAELYVFRLTELALAIAIVRIAGQLVFPCIGILSKWFIIGRFKEGSYNLWGSYYLRRQLVEQMLKVT